MKPINKKFISLFFLLAAAAPLLFAIVSNIKEKGIHFRMQQRLERDELQTLHLSENDVVWMDKDEIWVNDRMFDIHNKKLEKGVYTFTGLYDNEETELVNYKKQSTKKESDQYELLTFIFESLQNIFHSNSIENNSLYSQEKTYFHFISPICFHSAEILTPPPQA